MRSLRFVAVLFLASMLTLALGCGGGGGGNGGGGGGGLAKGTFTKTVTQSGALWGLSNFFGTLATNRYMGLFLAQDIPASGSITSLSFRYYSDLNSAVNCPDVTLKMGHTMVSTLSGTYADNYETGQGSLETVIDSSPLTIPAGIAGGYFTVSLETPFDYNGEDNLVIELTRNAACTATVQTELHGTNPAYDGVVYAGTAAAVTGTPVPYVFDMIFTFTGGDDIASVPTGTAVSHTFPFTSNPSTGRKAQFLYPAAEIDGSGPITGIAFMLDTTSTAASYTYTVRVGHATISSFAGNTTFDDNFSDTPVTMANNVSFTVPAGIPAGEYIWLPLPDGVFTYNGVDNLLIEIETSGSTGNIPLRAYTGVLADSKLSGDLGAATGVTWDRHHPVKVRFNGGTVNTLTGSSTPQYDAYPLYNGSSPKIQYLQPASMIGTKGSIKKVGFRLFYGLTTAATYSNVQIILGHTLLSGLTTTFADNMTDATTVYNGPLSVPAGLKAGDWLEIPLTTPFAYDGVDNLVVQMAADQGSAITYLLVYGPDARFLNGRLAAADRALPSGSLGNYAAAYKFWLTR